MIKHKTIARVCCYVVATKKVSGRAMARLLNIHHRTWQRYVNGQTYPSEAIKRKLVHLMQLQSFEELVTQAIQRYHWQGE